MVLYCVTKKRLFIVGILFFLMMFVSGIYALGNEINETENGISTGAVDIDISEYNQNNEPFNQNGKRVMPGEEIFLIPRVNNLGIECYIRTKITYTIDGEPLNEKDYIIGNYTSWNKDDEYYYYDSIFGKEESIDIFNKVIIPNNLSSSYEGKNIVISIKVDAIQAKNFDGNWEGIEIKESIDRTYNIDYEGESAVIYEDDTYNHISLDNEFFGDLGNILPGDSISENIKIFNKSKYKNEYFLTIDYDSLTEDEIKLLSAIELVVKNGKGDTIVESNLSNKNKQSIGIYQKDKGDNLKIILSLPNDIDNEYSKLFTKIIWRFSYEILDQGNPNTSDFQINLSITVFIISACGLIITLILWKLNTDNIEKI